jgi:hypothetical protein
MVSITKTEVPLEVTPDIEVLTKLGNDMLKMYKMGEQFLNANSHERLRIITAILDGLEIDINAVREYLQKFKKEGE